MEEEEDLDELDEDEEDLDELDEDELEDE